MNATRKCAHKSCGKRQPQTTMIVQGLQAWCSSQCQYSHALANLSKLRTSSARAVRAKDKAQRKEFRQRKQKLSETDLKWQKNRTKGVLHKLIKLLDKDQPCIVCNRSDCGDRSEWDAGHYLTKAAHPELKFDPRNIFKQCSPTNTASTGRSSAEASIRQKFEQNIIARYGQPLLDWLKSYRPPRKYTCEELAAMRAVFSAEVKLLEKGLPPSKNWRELPVSPSGQ